LDFDGNSPGKDVTIAELLPDLHKGCKCRFWTNAYGLNFHLCFDEDQTALSFENIYHIISGSIRLVYPFEVSFATAFSKKVLNVLKEELVLEMDTSHVIDVLIEWKSFSMLILSSKTSSPSDIAVYIGSKEYSLRF
jgi:hypothetical protein